MSANIYINDAFTVIPAKDASSNTTFADVIGNKTDVAAATADVVSVIGLLRYIIANMDTDADVAALIGALNTSAHTGAVDNATTIMGYVKQLITDERLIQTDLGDASAGTLGSIYAILGNPASSLATQIAAIGAVTAVLPNSGALTSLAQDSTVAKAASFGTLTNSGGTATVGGILGDVANNSIATRLTQLQNELSGTAGIASFPAAAAAANNVSLAEVIRYIQESQIGTLANSGGTATLGAILGDFNNVTLVSKVDGITTDTSKLYDSAFGVSPATGSLASFIATGGTALGTALPASKSLYDVAVLDTKIKQLINAAEGAGAFPASVLDNSILALILSKVANGDTSSYDNTTDSLEAISDAVTNASAGVSLVYTGTEHHADVITPDGSSTAWTQAAHRLFTVTGVVKVRVFGVVAEGLTGAATLEVGVAGATNCLIAQLADATTLAAADIFAGSTTATATPAGILEDYRVIANTDIDLLVGSANVTNGQITFYCDWIPVSSGATLVAAVWD